MAKFSTLTPETMYDVTGPDGQFVVRNMSGADISADEWQAGSCAWLTICPDGADDTDPADVAA